MNNTKVDHGTALILADRVQSIDLYRNMCLAIAECARVDQVKEIRNRAIAFEEYTRQSKNFEAEAQLSAIRARAERKAGELLIEMKENGEREGRGGDRKISKSDDATLILSDLNITKDQSSQWQQLARIPEPVFEQALAEPGIKRTRKLIAAHRGKEPVAHIKKATEDHYRRVTCDAVLKLADGKVHSLQHVRDITGLADIRGFLERGRMLPWLTIERVSDRFRFTVDEELRLICEDRAPRPQLNGVSIYGFIKRLTKEIYRRRKENNDRYIKSKWNPDNVLKTEQKNLLNWIETELSVLSQLMTPSGPDITSAIRTQAHPSEDVKEQNVFQEEYSDRTIDVRAC